MAVEQTVESLSPDEQRWLHSRLRARLGGELIDSNHAVEMVEGELADLLAGLLARRKDGEAQAAPSRPGGAHERDPRRRVVITGLGIITSVGQSVPAYWESLIAGRSGASYI